MLLEDDSSHAAIEADIRDDLAKIGITVTARPVDKDTFNTDMVAGNYDMVFSKTWGAPYDPHSYVNSWTTTDEGFWCFDKHENWCERSRRAGKGVLQVLRRRRRSDDVSTCVEIKILRRVRAESSRRPPRHRRDACSMASRRPPRHRRDACWMACRCWFLTARLSQDGRVVAEK